MLDAEHQGQIPLTLKDFDGRPDCSYQYTPQTRLKYNRRNQQPTRIRLFIVPKGTKA